MQNKLRKTNFFFGFLIATRNRNFQLLKLLNSIYKQQIKGFTFQVIVIDQGKKKLPNNAISHFKNFIYVQSESKGLSKARNIGLNYVDSKYILLLDDDAFIPNDYLSQMFNALKINNFCDIMCGQILNACDKKPYNRNMHFKKKNFTMYSFEGCLSSAMAIKLSIIERVGFFDENFGVGSTFGSCEETDFLIRTLKIGGIAKYDPSITVYHPKYSERNLSLSLIINRSLNYGTGRGAFIRKHLNKNIIWGIAEFFKSVLLLPFAGMILSLLRFNLKGFFRHLFNFLGRLYGFLSY